MAAAVAALLTVGCRVDESAGLSPGIDAPGTGERPNVLLVVIDALRRDHVGTYGYPLPTSPEIDRLAEQSFVFDRAYSHSTWTKPSLATLFTSLYPAQHGLGRVAVEDEEGFRTDALSKKLPTLAERMKRAGFDTAAFTTNVHIQRKTGFAQGFRHFFSRRLVDAFELNALLDKWLDERQRSEPFFVYLHYMDVHWPYDRRLPDQSGRFGDTAYEPAPPEHWSRVAAWAAEHLNPRSLAAIRAGYDQEIAFTDAAFGELLRRLGERGILERTIVVLVADHGEGFNEHGELQHGFAPFEEVTAIPLMIRLAADRHHTQTRIDDPVGLVDVMPTLLELVGVEAPAAIEGRSLVPLLAGEPLRERPVYVEGAGIQGLRGSAHSVLVDEAGNLECFDARSDREERSPLRDPLPAACTRLADALSTLERRFDTLPGTSDATETVPFDDEEVEALRALGYLK